MLTYASRAVARRVVTRRTAVAARVYVSYGSTVTRAIVARGFSSSQWRRLAAKGANAEEGTKKAAKKTTTKKTTTATKKTTAAKKKAAPKKKPAAKKAVKKPKKAKVVLTPEQKEKLKLRELKKASLLNKAPTLKPNRSWSVFVSQNHSKVGGDLPFLERVKKLKVEWDGMTESEKQRYASIAAVNAEDNKKTLKDWVLSYPVEEIIIANRARTQLRGLKNVAPRIHDDRVPKAPALPLARYLKVNLQSMSGQTNEERMAQFKSAVASWNNLPEEQKKPFYDSYEQEKAAHNEAKAPLDQLVQQKQKELKDAAKAAKAPKASKPSE